MTGIRKAGTAALAAAILSPAAVLSMAGCGRHGIDGSVSPQGVGGHPTTPPVAHISPAPGSQGPGPVAPGPIVPNPPVPAAPHTIVTTTGQVVVFDQWRDPIRTISTSDAWSATYVPVGGSILVADAGSWGGQAVEVGPAGNAWAAYDGSTFGLLGHVRDLHGASLTPSGTVLVADTGNDRVVELDRQNQVVWQFAGGLSAPSWAERMPDGDTLIADTGNNRVIEVNPGDSIVFGIGDGGTDVLNHPTHAQYLPASDTFLVSDAGNNRVMEINRQDQLVWMADGGQDKLGDGSGLNNPNCAIRLADGNTLIADTGDDRVVELTPARAIAWSVNIDQPLFVDRF